MTKDEALKLALEALEVATTPLAKDRQEVLRARDAIKEALAQPEQKPVAWRAWFDADNGARWLFSLWPEEERLNVEWTPLYTSPPQPEQSQVEETLRYEIDALETKLAECRAQQEHVATSDTSEKRVDEMAKQRHESEPVIDKSAAVRIATALGWEPKRTWVGLTQEDIDIAFDETQEGGGFWEFADAIEAKLKEKNT